MQELEGVWDQTENQSSQSRFDNFLNFPLVLMFQMLTDAGTKRNELYKAFV